MAMNLMTQALNAEQQEIARLLIVVAGQNAGDVYLGKRGRRRYRLHTPFDAMLDLSDPSSVFPVMLHNLCESGIGFLARRQFSRGENLYIREFTDDGTSAWLRIQVTHCTQCVSGFIIGAEHYCPISEEDWAPTEDALERGADLYEETHSSTATPPRRQGLLAWLGLDLMETPPRSTPRSMHRKKSKGSPSPVFSNR